MWTWLKNLMRPKEESNGKPPPEEDEDPALPPDLPPPWPSRCDTLVLYAVSGDGVPPDTRTESMVVEYLDPLDQLVTFEADIAPLVRWWRPQALEARLESVRERGGLRDPNSSARLHWVLRWMREHEGAWVAAQLEPEPIAGNGTAFARGKEEEARSPDPEPEERINGVEAS